MGPNGITSDRDFVGVIHEWPGQRDRGRILRGIAGRSRAGKQQSVRYLVATQAGDSCIAPRGTLPLRGRAICDVPCSGPRAQQADRQSFQRKILAPLFHPDRLEIRIFGQ